MRKEKFLHKLVTLLNHEWPAKTFTVHAFGSTENMLGTRYSDGNSLPLLRLICQLTSVSRHIGLGLNKGLVSYLPSCTDVSGPRTPPDIVGGMQQVECRSQAKVPLVSFHDIELDISCDLNINNTIALRNTRMVRTYMQIDVRAQILTIMVKHWAKARGINDAGLLSPDQS